MSRQSNRANRHHEAEMFDLMIHGICRGWLASPPRPSYGGDGGRLKREDAPSGPLFHISPGGLASSLIAVAILAVIGSGIARPWLMDPVRVDALANVDGSAKQPTSADH